MTTQLFPRKPRRMKQPRKDVLREQLATAANTIIGLREELVRMDTQVQYAREDAQRFAADMHQAKRRKPIWNRK